MAGDQTRFELDVDRESRSIRHSHSPRTPRVKLAIPSEPTRHHRARYKPRRSPHRYPGIKVRTRVVDRGCGSAYMFACGSDDERWPAGQANYDPGPCEGSDV